MRKIELQKNNGITLVALVVTIVVLLILAGITIMYTMGDNSIFKKAQEAKNKTEEAIKNEQEYMNLIDNIINEYTNGMENPTTPENPWAKIDRIAKAIANDNSITNNSTQATGTTEKGEAYDIKVGDILEVGYNGEAKRVRILGFKHDDLVDQSVYGGMHEKASISFEFSNFITGDNYMSMNPSDTNEGGWGATQIRKDLNGYATSDANQNGVIGGLGANLNNKSYIKQVKKKYVATYNDASSVTTCNDYLWLLAASEIVNSGYQSGAYGNAITSEGSQYKYYQGITEPYNAASTSRVKKTSESGDANHWWIRSSRYSTGTSFCFVSNGGDVNGSYVASYAYGVVPGFCI